MDSCTNLFALKKLVEKTDEFIKSLNKDQINKFLKIEALYIELVENDNN
jgi:hypothetical protein